MKTIRSTVMKTSHALAGLACAAAAMATLPSAAHSATPSAEAAKAAPGMRLNPQPLPPRRFRPVHPELQSAPTPTA